MNKFSRKRYKCKHCGYEWGARVEVPAQCPRCKRYDYREDNQVKGGGTNGTTNRTQ